VPLQQGKLEMQITLKALYFGQILKGMYGHIKPKYRNELQYIIIKEKIKQAHSFPQLIVHESYKSWPHRHGKTAVSFS
jgi:hypothetical protein